MSSPAWGASARVLMRLSWARTGSRMLVIGLAVLVALPMLFALGYASRDSGSDDAAAFLIGRYDDLVCSLSAPLVALLLGTSAFSAESEDGTLLYLVTTTIPRWYIVAVRVVFAGVLTGLLAAVSVVGTGVLVAGFSDPKGVITAYSLAVMLGGFAYGALFTAIALFTRRALVTGLLYVLFWEGFLNDALPALQYLSVRRWMQSVASAFTSGGAEVRGPSMSYALVASVLLVLVTVYAGGRKLHTPRIGRLTT